MVLACVPARGGVWSVELSLQLRCIVRKHSVAVRAVEQLTGDATEQRSGDMLGAWNSAWKVTHGFIMRRPLGPPGPLETLLFLDC